MQLSIGTERSASDPEGIVLTVNFTVGKDVAKITPCLMADKKGSITVESILIEAVR